MAIDQDRTRAELVAKAKKAFDQLKLARINDVLSRRSDLLNGRMTPLQDRLTADFVSTITAAQDEAAAGFRPAPAHLLPEGFAFAAQEDGTSVCLPETGHGILVGPSGSGKTTTLIRAYFAAREKERHVFILDLKNDFLFAPTIDPDFLLLRPDTPVNPLRCPSYLTLAEHKANFKFWFLQSQYSGALQAHVLDEAIERVFRLYKCPSLADLKRVVDELYSKTDTYSRRDAIQGISHRLAKIEHAYPVAFRTRDDGIPIETFLDRSVYVDAIGQDDITEYFFTYLLVNQLYLRNRKCQDRRPASTLICMDESLFSFSVQHAATRLSGMNLMGHLVTLIREFGGQLVVNAISLAAIDPLLLRSATMLGLLPGVTEFAPLHALGFTTAELDALRYDLMTGTIVIKYLQGQWRAPFVAYVQQIPASVKHADLERLAEAQERTNALAPPAVPSPVEAPESILPPGLVLSREQDRFHRRVATGPFVPTTSLYAELGLHPQTGDRIKNFLIKTGLEIATPVVARPGRSRPAMVLSATTAGYAHLGMTPRRGSRGGSIPHSFYVQELTRRITDAHQELTLRTLDDADTGTKCADVVFRYDPAKHSWLAPFLMEWTATPAGDEPYLKDGGLIAIEVEISDPITSSTNNATKDLKGGVDLVLIALRQADLNNVRVALQQHTPADAWPHIAIVPLLHLLDTIKPPEGTP